MKTKKASIRQARPKAMLHKELHSKLQVFMADQANSMLPSERDMMKMFNISRTTVRRAIQSLVLEGKVRPAHGKGNLIVRKDAAPMTGSILLFLRENSERYQIEAFETLLGMLADRDKRAITILLRNGESPVEKIADVIDKVDGVVLAEYLSDFESLYKFFSSSAKRVAVLRHKPCNYPFSFASEDRAEAFQILVKHLASLGHRKIAYVSYFGDNVRLEGLKRGFEESGLTLDKDLMVNSLGRTPDGFNSTDELLKRGKPFTAIIAQNDECALGVMHRLILAGLRIPQDVSLTGYDNLSESANYPIPLTTCGGDLGFLCGKIIDYILSPFEVPRLELMIHPVLNIRSSTGAPNRQRKKAKETVSYD